MELEGTEEASITACRYLPGCRERQVSEFKKGNDMPDSSAYLSVPALACQGSIARSYIGPIRLYKQAYSLPYLWGQRVRTQILRIPDYAVIYYVLFCGFVAVDEARSRLRYLSRQVGIFKAAIASSWRLTKKEQKASRRDKYLLLPKLLYLIHTSYLLST